MCKTPVQIVQYVDGWRFFFSFFDALLSMCRLAQRFGHDMYIENVKGICACAAYAFVYKLSLLATERNSDLLQNKRRGA
jgi:hypothetical protein